MADRWDEVLDTVGGLLPGGAAVLVDGGPAGLFADRLAAALESAGRRCVRPDDRGVTKVGEVTLVAGGRWRAHPPAGRWDVVVWLRTAPSGVDQAHGDDEHGDDIVLDLHDATWPVIRRVSEHLDPDRSWYPRESRAFFAARASSWDTRFGDDMPAYARAVSETGIRPGGVVLDAGCGTGRALPALRAAAGADGTVIGLDITPEMLAEARHRGRAGFATLLLGDARRLPLADDSVDDVFAAGLVMHLPDLTAGLTELARVVRPGGRLAIFHPSGRAALAARHGRTLRTDDPLNEPVLVRRLIETGWTLIRYEDPPDRFLALAVRSPWPPPPSR